MVSTTNICKLLNNKYLIQHTATVSEDVPFGIETVGENPKSISSLNQAPSTTNCQRVIELVEEVVVLQFINMYKSVVTHAHELLLIYYYSLCNELSRKVQYAYIHLCMWCVVFLPSFAT